MPDPLNHFLHQHFPGLKLQTGLFYSWPVGLRFELATDTHIATTDDYFREAVHRASVLFQAVFQPDDEVLVVYQQPADKRRRIRVGNFLLRQCGIGRSQVRFQRIPAPHPDSYCRQWHRASFLTPAAAIHFPAILTALAHQDFPPRKPALHGEVFFIHPRRGLIWHMYDDRGLDILAPAPAALQDLYHTHHAWLLDYDRARMRAVFEPPRG
ncbi:DUF3885 domain-containing protein [Hymenobacter sp. B81]|uniref:DUF3885 domain-containing protein n=1 Tax=Hymenobacter sp. B81 TaxID=3344878 RepID=UPI0037DC9E19